MLRWSLTGVVATLGLLGALGRPATIRAASPASRPTAVAATAPVTAAQPGPMLRAMLAGPMAGTEEIVFTVRRAVNYHYYENFGEFVYHVKKAYAPPEEADAGPPLPLYAEGGRLCRLNLRTGKLTILLDDPRGSVRDPQVHYGGQKILFSYRRGEETPYHLWEIGCDGAGLKQLTAGPFDDVEPTYTPDGGIVFCSSRCHRYVGCNPSPVAILYRCEADGQRIRPLSAGAFTENTPWMLPDGRVLYTRWEYVDRNQLSFHHLWTMNPDGTDVMVFFGNQYTGRDTPIPRFADVAMLDAKPIPGTRKIVAAFSPGHGRGEHLGYVTVIDAERGPDATSAARPINRSRMFRDPWAFSQDCFLAADSQGIWLMDGEGQTELLYRLPPANAAPGKPANKLRTARSPSAKARWECHEPRPLAARTPEPKIPTRTDLEAGTGRLVLSDVYKGRNMDGVRRGEIKRLLVLEQLPKPVQFSGGQEPLTIGGPFALTRILGTVPVEPDGSAHLEVPALRALYFAALDENGLTVKRMHSFVNVMPGETVSCVGCHEPRLMAPHVRTQPDAATRPPSRIEPFLGVPDVFDYPRDIQPILDKHCVKCHNADRWEGRVDLSGDYTPLYSQSYWSMVLHGLFADGRNYTGNSPPRSVGSGASRLVRLVDGSHYGARLSTQEQLMLRLWIDSGAAYPGTYAALGSGMALVQFPREAFQRRCAACHRAEPTPYVGMPKKALHYKFGHRDPPQVLSTGLSDFLIIRRLAYFKFGEAPPAQALCNLTRPEKSLLVRAPLSASSGGLGLCRGEIFAGTSDPDYQQLLGAIADAGAQLRREKRFDMAGFRPNKYYLRLMQSYGILPADLAPNSPIDPYALDRAYWEHLGHRPVRDND